MQVGRDAQRLQIEIGLVEAIEEHESARACFYTTMRKIGQRAEVGTELHGNRRIDLGADILDQRDVLVLQLGGGQVSPCRQVVNIQLQRVRARRLDAPRVLHPAAG